MRARLSGVDTCQLGLESHKHYMHTFKVAILDPSSDPEGWCYERYRDDFSKRLHRLPWLRWRFLPTPLGLNYPVWVDDEDFNLDYHLRQVACPAPGDQKALCKFMSSVYIYQLDRSRPLWINWVVEGLEGGRVAMVTLLHHAYVDGVGASAALEQLYSNEPGWVPDPAPPWKPEKYPSRTTRLWWGLRDLPAVLASGVPKVIRGISAKRKLDREWLEQGRVPHPEPAMAPHTPLNRPVSAGRTFVCDSMPLADLKRVSKGFGVTINDVFLACTAATIRRYLQDQAYDVDSQPLVAGIPFGLERPVGREYLGNYSTKDCTWLHTDVDDPLERLKACSQSAREMKEHLGAVLDASADIGSVLGVMPPMMFRVMGRTLRRQAEKAGTSLFGNLVVSNVPGPRERLYLKDYTLENWYSIGQIFDGANLNFTLWSYCGNANLCILADSEVVPDGWVLYRYFTEEVKTLLALVPENPAE